MKTVLFVLLFLFTAVPLFSQTASPDVIITSGEVIESEDGSISWTIGENLIETVGEADLNLLQGYQEVEDFPAAIESNIFEEDGVLIFPTRTHTTINVIIPGEINLAYTVKFIDLTGRVVSENVLFVSHNEISLEDFSCGMYLLKITRGEYPVTENKIIKY